MRFHLSTIVYLSVVGTYHAMGRHLRSIGNVRAQENPLDSALQSPIGEIVQQQNQELSQENQRLQPVFTIPPHTGPSPAIGRPPSS